MEKVLVLGGPNFIGRALLDKLAGSANYEIWGLNRVKQIQRSFLSLNELSRIEIVQQTCNKLQHTNGIM